MYGSGVVLENDSIKNKFASSVFEMGVTTVAQENSRLKQLYADILSANNTVIGFRAFTPETNATKAISAWEKVYT
jgi:hypothetical protein